MSTLYQHFEYRKKCPPHYSTMVSALFHQISMPEKCLSHYSTMVSASFQHVLLQDKVSALLQHYGACLIPAVVCLIPTHILLKIVSA